MKNENKLDKNLYKEIENEYEIKISKDISKESPTTNKNKNLWIPLSKIVIIFLITLLGITYLNNDFKNTLKEYSPKITGTWIDENNIYYEITEKSFEMNAGQKDNPFYKGTITNITKTETGYKVLVKGTKYDINNNNEEIDMNVTLELQNYNEEYNTTISAKFNETELSIIRVQQ